jgi:hypothetical protein
MSDYLLGIDAAVVFCIFSYYPVTQSRGTPFCEKQRGSIKSWVQLEAATGWKRFQKMRKYPPPEKRKRKKVEDKINKSRALLSLKQGF